MSKQRKRKSRNLNGFQQKQRRQQQENLKGYVGVLEYDSREDAENQLVNGFIFHDLLTNKYRVINYENKNMNEDEASQYLEEWKRDTHYNFVATSIIVTIISLHEREEGVPVHFYALQTLHPEIINKTFTYKYHSINNIDFSRCEVMMPYLYAEKRQQMN